ncbi:MAG: inositol monophosphatase family protein [Candidatus Wallbacteria bacterium]|nr:inositol monophosphatase family protein [Candidatus Wallbacteria bacterium]
MPAPHGGRTLELAAIREALEFAVEAAQLAGAFTLGYFNTGTPHELKADRSPVTAADRGSEELLRRRIARAFPDDGVLGEEFGETPGRSPGRWILDPIDGTFSFISGVPLYSVLVAYEWAGELVAGVIHMPALHETVWAGRGLGVWWNGRRARVSEANDLAEARVLSCGSKMFGTGDKKSGFDRLVRACRADRSWCDAYAYALLATGRAEVVLDLSLSLWDTAALYPVVTEAGGTFTDWSGHTTPHTSEVIATNGKLLPAVLAELRAGKPGTHDLF